MRLSTLSLALLLAGCSDASGPSRTEPRVLVDLGESSGFAVLDQDFEFVGHVGDFARMRTPIGLDGDAVHFLAAGGKPAELVAFSGRRLTFEHREGTAAIRARSTMGAIELHGRLVVVALNDDVILDGARDDVFGLIRVSGDPRRPASFAGPLYVRGDGAVRTADALFAVASRTASGLRYLFELDPLTLEVRDSVPAGQSGQVIASPGGVHLYLRGPGIRRFDTRTRQFTAEASTAAVGPHARLHVSRNGARIYLTDPGNFFDHPGPGVIYAWTSELQPLPPVDLGETGIPGSSTPPVASGIATSAAGDTLFIATGTTSIGPLYGRQPAYLLMLDSDSHQLLRRIDLNGWGPGAVILPR
jgi:hypothetical protein